MTAERTGRLADGVLATLKRLKEQWMLVTALAGALFWARDLVEIHARLPGEVERQAESLAALAARVETALAVDREGGGPGVAAASPVPPRMVDAAPGTWTALIWQPSMVSRPECVARELSAEMVDATGSRLTAETDLAPPPAYAGGPEPAYGVKVHPRMAVGRAAFRARVGVLCAGRMLGERTPWTAFDVRAD